ncbi:MAG: hypothetical protein AB1540_02880 [Bdellovibrionota bacterium]
MNTNKMSSQRVFAVVSALLLSTLIYSSCGKKGNFSTAEGVLVLALEALKKNDLSAFRNTLAEHLQNEWGTKKGMEIIRADIAKLPDLSVGDSVGGSMNIIDREYDSIQNMLYYFPIYSENDKQVGEFAVLCNTTYLPGHEPVSKCAIGGFTINEANVRLPR